MARGRRTHLLIRMGPSHLLDRQDDELQAASLVEAGIPIPHRSDLPTCMRKQNPGLATRVEHLVARTRFELVISALRGRRPEPLDERAI